MPDSTVAVLLAKVKVLGGPIAAGLLLGASAGWYARGERATAETLAARVEALDSTTVKRPEFELLVRDLRTYAAKTDSTNALLRRYICRDAPAICP